jgi:hypothetical protein
MSKAQTDIRTTSYDAATANPHGYVGTLEDALTQIRAEPATLAKRNGRALLLYYLGAFKAKSQLSGVEAPAAHMDSAYIFPMNEDEDDSVEYGAPEAPPEPGRWSLAYAVARGWLPGAAS